MPKIVIAGSVNQDLVAVAPRHPGPGETVTGSSFTTFVGGKGANQAIAVARLGTAVVLVATAGVDAAGDEIAAFLAAESIDLSHLRRDARARTGMAMILLANDNNAMVVLPGANMLTSPEQVRAVAIDAGDVCMAQLEIPQETVVAFFERARTAGATTILNAAPVKPCAAEVFALADIVVMNEEEAAYHELSEGGAILVTTLGAHGVRATNQNLTIGGHPVTVADTTGAGDAFCGALAASLVSGAQFSDSLARANAYAALCVQRMGASSMPTRSELDAFLD